MGKLLLMSTAMIAFCSVNLSAKVTFQEAKSVAKRVVPGANGDKILSYYSILKEPQKSIVNISTTKKVYLNNQMYDLYQNPFFRDFFGQGFHHRIPKKLERKSYALGSGVIVTSDGYIVTNNHVVANADKIKVTIQGKDKEYDAKVVGKDPKTDIAVIKIKAKNLHPIKFADSSRLKVGDVVFAIGDPFGVGKSVTSGIISALNKNKVGINQYENFIQTDASINPGNSGGALVDSRGDLIGINSAIITRSGGNNGIGFAIPSNMVKKIALALINNGEIQRGYLGVSITDLSSDLKSIYNHKHGAFVLSTAKDTPAYKAGIKRGDLIFEVDRKSIKDANELKNFIGSLKPDKEITLKIETGDHKVKVVNLKLAKMPDSDKTAFGKGKNGIEGLKVVELNKEIRYNYQIPRDVNGVLVTDVEDNSVADNMGFKIGDIIIQINNKMIKNIDDYKNAVKNLKKGVIYIQRGDYVIPLVYKAK
ncbi:MAG: Do family serine endopeptidase [Epsilonproteobacteria bacterium]|nr:Do family serine endopeptidase [Campylobacterota bacterium]